MGVIWGDRVPPDDSPARVKSIARVQRSPAKGRRPTVMDVLRALRGRVQVWARS